MPLDSLGLGLTLDTTLLEKADKTLENMHKNSKLIMQNLTRGISAFNSGAITDFADVLNNVQEALSKMDGTKMSIDYDKKGLEEYKSGINDILDLTVRLSEKFGDMKFYDPKRVNRTDESPREVRKRLNELLEEYKTFEAKLNKADEFDADSDKYTKQLTDSKAEIEKLTPSVEKLKEAYEKAKDAYQKYVDTQSKKIREKTPEATDEEIQKVLLSRDAYIKKATAMLEAQKAYKEEESLLKAQQKLYGDATAAKFFSDNRQELEENSAMLRESIKNAAADLAWANKTIAEKDEELLKDQKARDNEEKSRIAGIQSTYKEIRKAIEQGEKELAEAEKRRDTIAKGKGDTSEYDAKIQELKAFLDEKKDIETSWRKSQYWPALEAIDKQFNKKKLEDEYKQRISSPTVAFANQYSKNATSIDEETQAVKMLEAARDSLSNSTAHYDQVVNALNKRIAKHEDHIKLLTQEQKESKELQDSVISRYIREKKEIKELNKVLKELHEKQASTGIKTTEEDKYEQDIIARRQRLWNDVHQIEVDNAKQIAQLKEKYDASVAEEKIQEIIKTNEKEKQEYAKLLDDLYALEKQKKAMEDAGAKTGDKAYDKLLGQEANLIAQKHSLETKHQNDLDEIRAKHNKKRNDDEVKAFIDAQKEKQKIAEETQKKIDAYNEKYGTTSKRNAEMAITSFSGAQNINQHKQAIEGLQQVRARLDNTDKDYYETLKKLNREIHSHELFIRAAENESVRLGNSHRGLMDISGQLMRRLALVFSVSQITQYFRKLVEVRGQFEKTEVALTSIVGSQEKSNKLMNQTIALAIKSPFTLQQLTGYTKQLAAYQVAYEQLHDTTKMLADVSAGLGVEMDRLILAFGQVKAANYLRATEVRQFTEAGFNILGELAKYYTELEGTMVSVGDVQERVTKRMVDFADVEEIFHRVTEAGGMFYDMQSKQAETLAGQWTNLQDRIDVMLNEIGTDKEGILKFFVRFLASAIDNWEVLASSIKTAAAAFLIFKTYSLLAGDGMKLLAIQMGVLTNSVPKVLSLGQAFKTLGKVVGSAVTKIGTAMSGLLTNPIFIAIAAIGALIGAGVSLYRHFDKLNDALKEQSDSFNEYTSSLNKLSKEYNKLDKFTEKLAKLEELKGRLNERGLNLSVKIDEVNTDNIDEIFTEHTEILQKSYDLGLSVGNAITRGLNAAQGNIFGWSIFGENLAEDAEDFASKWNKLASYGMDAQMRAMENEIEANEKASKAALAIYERISEGRKAERDENGKIVKYLESEYEWTMRRAKALKEIQDLEDGSVTKNNKLSRYIRQVTRHEKELNHEVDSTIKKLAKEFGGIEKLMQAAKDNPVEFSAAIQAEVDKQAWDEVTKWVYSQRFHARLDITPNYVEPTDADAKKLAQFQQDLVDARANLEKKGKGYQNFFISKEEIEQMKFFSDGIEGIQKLYDENKKTIEQLDGTAENYNKEELARLNALQKQLEAVAKKWGYNLNANSKGNSASQKILNDRISLVKELNKKYEELNKTFDENTSKQKVIDAYSDTFKKAFEGTGIDLSTLIIDKEKLDELQKTGKEAGKVFSDAMLSEMNKMAEEGAYIRDFTEDAINFIKENEGKPILTAKDVEKKGLGYTIGYGEYQKYKDTGKVIQKGDTITEEEALRRLTEIILPQFKKELNGVLDANKDLIFTQEQYNALLDLSFQGGVGKVKDLIKYSQDEAEGLKHITEIQEKVNEVFGEEQAARFGEAFISKFKEAESVYDRMALLFQTMNLTIDGGKISEDLYEGMQKRSDKRAALFSGDLEVIKLLKKSAIDVSQIDFTNLEGVVAILKKLKPLAKKEGKEAEQALSRAISQVEAEIGVKIKEKEDEKLNDEIQSLFDRYELTLDIKKIGMPQGLAEDLFDTKFLDLKGLREAVKEREAEFVGTDQEKQYKEFLDKIDEMERKSIIERTKTYSEYLMRGMTERTKLKVEELRKLKELEESKEFTIDQKKQIREQIQADSQKKLDKAKWEEFTGMDSYIMMFEDLETLGTQSIKNLYENLDKLRLNLSHLDPSDVKEIVNQMEKLQEEMIKRNPFKAFRDARKDIKAVGEDEETLITRLFSKEKIEAEAQAMIESISTIENAFASGTFDKLRDEDKNLFESFIPQLAEGKDLAKIKEEYQDMLDAAREGKTITADRLKNFANYRKALQGISEYWGAINDQIQNIVGNAVNIMEVYGVDESTKAIAEGVGNMSMLITQAVQFGIQMQAVGYASNMALGVIGWIAMGVQAIATIISSIANYENAQIDAQLEEQSKKIEHQRDLYEQIEEKVEKAYNVDQLRQYNNEMERSVELEIKALEASIALERSRKKADQDQIAEYEAQIIEARERLADSKKEMMEELGGIFDITDFTSGFVEAWWDAMEEGMSGLDALGEHFEDTMKDMVKKQALYKGASNIMKQVQDAINKSLEGDYSIDKGEWDTILAAAKKANIDLDAFLQGYYDMFGSLSDGASGGLSALQKGIQGITEDSAQIIEAYLNSVRGYVSEQVTHTKNIYRILNDAVHSDAAAIRVRMV